MYSAALIKEKYKEDKRVRFAIVDDKKIGLTGTFSEEAWKIWGKELFETAEINPDDRKKNFTWYTGEESYSQLLLTLVRSS